MLLRTKPQLLRNNRKTTSKPQREPRQNRKLWRSQVYTAAKERTVPVPTAGYGGGITPSAPAAGHNLTFAQKQQLGFASPGFQNRESGPAANAHLYTWTGSQF